MILEGMIARNRQIDPKQKTGIMVPNRAGSGIGPALFFCAGHGAGREKGSGMNDGGKG